MPTQQEIFRVDVLISWSKSQSKEMALLFRRWLPEVVPGLQPWMSSKDIEKGKPWFSELQKFLGEATSCIICLTSENVRSPWLYYETGAIATKTQHVSVSPYLIGIGVSMIADGPLAQYQCTEATKEDTLELVRSLNKALATPHDEGLLDGNFEAKWPEYENELRRILDTESSAAPADFVETEADILAGYRLSAEARKLLISAAGGSGYVTLASGGIIKAGEEVLSLHNHRSIALWKQAINDLLQYGLLSCDDRQGSLFGVSGKGYQVVDLLQRSSGT